MNSIALVTRGILQTTDSSAWNAIGGVWDYSGNTMHLLNKKTWE